MSKTLDEAGIILQPLRFRIFKSLKEAKKPLYIDQIAEMVKEDRRLVSYHLATMEEYGFATSEFKEITPATSNPGKGKAGRFYSLTEKGDRVLAALKKEI